MQNIKEYYGNNKTNYGPQSYRRTDRRPIARSEKISVRKNILVLINLVALSYTTSWSAAVSACLSGFQTNKKRMKIIITILQIQSKVSG